MRFSANIKQHTVACVCVKVFVPHMLALGRTLEGACAEMMK